MDLAAFPSAAGLDPDAAKPGLRSRIARIVFIGVAGVSSIVLLIVAAVLAMGVPGAGADRLRAEAEQAIEQLAGTDMVAALGPVRITFDRFWSPAIEVRDVSFRSAADGADVMEAGLVRFGFRLLPLLSGDLRLSSATLGEARILAAALPESDWVASVRNEQGLIDPDRLAEAVFRMTATMLDAVHARSTRRIALEKVDIVLSGQNDLKLLRIAKATLAETGPGSLELSGEADIDGRAMTITATARRDPASRRIIALEATASSPMPEDFGASGAAAAPGLRIGSLDLRLSGAEGTGAEPSRLIANLTMTGSEVDLGKRGAVSGDVEMTASLTSGEGRLDVRRLRVTTGRSVLDFDGAVTSQPDGIGGEPAYRYRLISRRLTVAPEQSPAPALNAQLRVDGKFDPAARILHANSMILKSSGRGEVLGTASVEFVEGKVPGMFAAFSVHDMPVAQVKQLWPWFSAPPARLWVLSKLFGGRVSDGRLHFRVPPGRLGDGVPLTAQEAFGTIAVRGTRFDTAGLIPPVRDAAGSVNFRGHDVDVTLTSGTVFMPSGRTILAGDGRLEIRQANVRPVIGKLDVDVAGDASALAELASYDPINAMRFVEFAPTDFAGEVSGNVKADIPLQKGVDASKLNWLVALDYEDLSIAKPVDGRMITEADGSITVVPGKMVIATKAKLSGVSAEIDLVEPLGKSGVERERKIVLVLDEKGRDILTPGLSAFVDGTIKVRLDSLDGGKQKVAADVTAAKIDIPWAGWTKGPGIAGTVGFVLENEDGKSVLSDFSLSGNSFAIDGAITLSDGSLDSARFSQISLNRGDDVAVSVDKAGAGYAVSISGNSFDARSVVKQFTADGQTATKASDGGSVSVKADVKSLKGFHGERLSNLKLDYSGSGSTVNSLQVSASTKSGAAVNIRSNSEGGGRTMRMQSGDAGAILRFLDIYENMEGGAIRLSLAGAADAPMTGQVDARDFWVVNEPRLGSIVSSTPPGDSRSLNQAVKRDLDTSRVKFERGFSEINKGSGYLALSNGVLRGPLIGATFQGTLYDKAGNMAMTGTFMPAYGLNRLFAELPIIGVILGNGRDRGLIGVTFKLSGDANAPNLQINPLSVIAPGIFRSIFEYQ